jgi:uracil-DNA glycosylase family 4
VGKAGDALRVVEQEVIACRKCPRLTAYRETVARVKRRAYMDWEYWGRPVPSFGDPNARLFIIGLAPAAHGGNRTGRVFTGDRSGDFLFRALHAAGFASQAESVSRDDGLELRDAFVAAAVRCCPPGNKPLPREFQNCRPYLERELDLLANVKVVVALGRLAFDVYLSILLDRGVIAKRSAFQFAHNAAHITAPGQPLLISSYHPSQQNTQTGRLTDRMFRDVLERARRHIRGASQLRSARS